MAWSAGEPLYLVCDIIITFSTLRTKVELCPPGSFSGQKKAKPYMAQLFNSYFITDSPVLFGRLEVVLYRKGLHPFGQPGNFTGRGLFMQHALGHAAH